MMAISFNKKVNMDYNEICRICMKRSDLQSIFEYKIKSGESIDLSQKLKVCCNVDVDINDKLPSHICGECSDGLLFAYDLIVLCKSTDELLRKNIKIENEIPVEEKRTEYAVYFESDNEQVDVDCTEKTDLKDSYDNDNSNDVKQSDFNLKKVCHSMKSGDVESGDDFEYSSGSSDLDEREHNQKPGFVYISVDNIEQSGVRKKSYKCYACELRFPSRWNRELHEDLVCPKMPPGSIYQCRLCSVSVVNRHKFDEHIWMSHRGGLPPKERMSTKDILVAKNGPSNVLCMGQICEVCGFFCKIPNRYKEHRKTHEPKVLHQCSECSFSSTHRYAYTIHMKYTHNGFDPIKCEHCPYTTGKRDNFKKHMMKHTGERPYSCSVCGYRTIDNGNIKRHMVKHTHSKNYKCDICGSLYPRSNSLKRHVQEVHEQMKRLICKYPKCKYRCFKEDLMNKHIAEKHGADCETFT